MKGLFPNCPGCGNAYSFRHGASQGYACHVQRCPWGIATTYIPEILKDRTVYTLSIDALPDESLRSIARLALRLGLSSAEVRQRCRSLPIPVARASASKVFSLRQELETEGYRVSIVPPFPYDVFDPNPEGKFPLTEEQIKALRNWPEPS